MIDDQLKYYRIRDLDQLEAIRSWVMQVSNRAQIFEEPHPEGSQYTVVVNDSLGMQPVSPRFDSEFGTSVEAWRPGH